MSFLHYFGHSDANDEKSLSQFFYRSSLFDALKKGDREEGKFVIHGIKGSGKSAMCKMLQEENASRIVCKVDKAFSVDVRKTGDYSSPVEGVMISLLLNELIRQVYERKDEFSGTKVIKSVDTLTDRVKSIFGRVLSATKVGYGPVSFDLQKIFSSNATGFSRFKIAEYVDALAPALKQKQAYILLDDIDDVFIGADKNAAFVEGLLRAAKEINKAFGPLVHCLVFLKSGLFKQFFGTAGEYDKLGDFVASISWGKEQLAELLAARIAQKHKPKQKEAWKLWQIEFVGSGQGEIETIQEFIVNRCVSGPRDLIVFCNMAKERVGAERIGMTALEEVADRYSKEKLAGIGRDFGKTYARIGDFLQQVFAGERQVYNNHQLQDLLTKKVVANVDVQKLFDDSDYVRFATKENLLELLYATGFIGFKRVGSSEVEFVITNPEPGSKVLNTAQQYQIHHAYAECLNLRT